MVLNVSHVTEATSFYKWSMLIIRSILHVWVNAMYHNNIASNFTKQVISLFLISVSHLNVKSALISLEKED